MTDELKLKILSHFDELSFLDFMELSLEDLVEAFADEIKEKQVELEQETR